MLHANPLHQHRIQIACKPSIQVPTVGKPAGKPGKKSSRYYMDQTHEEFVADQIMRLAEQKTFNSGNVLPTTSGYMTLHNPQGKLIKTIYYSSRKDRNKKMSMIETEITSAGLKGYYITLKPTPNE